MSIVLCISPFVNPRFHDGTVPIRSFNQITPLGCPVDRITIDLVSLQVNRLGGVRNLPGDKNLTGQ
jgi:hypothetical protein